MATRDSPRSRYKSSASADLASGVAAVVHVVVAANYGLAQQVFHQVGAHDDVLVERRDVDRSIRVGFRQTIDVSIAESRISDTRLARGGAAQDS